MIEIDTMAVIEGIIRRKFIYSIRFSTVVDHGLRKSSVCSRPQLISNRQATSWIEFWAISKAYLRKTIRWPNNCPIKHLSLSITEHNHPERRIWSRNNAWIYNLIGNNPKVPTLVSSNFFCKKIKWICYSVWKPKFQSYEKFQHFEC